MRNKMERLASKLNKEIMYFTENPINLDTGDKFWDCKYYLCYQNTHKIFFACKSQNEMIEKLEVLIAK